MYKTATLQSRLFTAPSFLKQSLICSFGMVFLAFSAHLIIPLQPVPLTFQSSAAIFLGLIMGPRLAAMTLIGYFAAGFIGLPVLASGTQFGPTMGYLIGFLPGALISGWLAEHGMAKTILRSFIASLAGTVAIFACGLSVLAHFVGWHQSILLGLLPFIITEPLKLLAISLVTPRFWKNPIK